MNDINKLYDNKIINILLKNDCVIYGEFLRNYFIDSKLLENNIDLTIHCYSKYLLKNILERDLNKYNLEVISESKNILYSLSVFNTEKFKYILNYNEKKYIIIVSYFKKSIDNYNNSDLDIIVDIDSLKLDRNLLGFIKLKDMYNTEPVPLKSILNNIFNKTYNITIKKDILKKHDYLYLITLVESGWKYIHNTTKNIASLTAQSQLSLLNDTCGLCNYKHNSSTIKLSCNHYYHKQCILNYLKYYINNTFHTGDLFKCPYCTKTIDLLDIL